MLPAERRLRSSRDFSAVMRSGTRAGRPTLTVHLLTDPAADQPPPARAGLIISKAVGGSVTRHRVARRLRHLLAERVAGLAPGSRLVVRAAPSAATATSAELARDLDAALQRLSTPGKPA
jgi:ribonuclease P protein component